MLISTLISLRDKLTSLPDSFEKRIGLGHVQSAIRQIKADDPCISETEELYRMAQFQLAAAVAKTKGE